jgi:hypothetical protein
VVDPHPPPRKYLADQDGVGDRTIHIPADPAQTSSGNVIIVNIMTSPNSRTSYVSNVQST